MTVADLPLRLSGRTVLIVGDVMLDHFVIGRVDRISPEAPVPVVRLARETENPGGAANVAMNLAGLGVRESLGGYVGNDLPGSRLKESLRAAGIEPNAVVSLIDRPTTTKTRIVGGHQQMMRVDREETSTPLPSAVRALVDLVDQQFAFGLDAVVLSDYNKGVLSSETCTHIIREARLLGVPVLVDPKGKDYAKYAGATTLSPNEAELASATGVPVRDVDALLAAGQRLSTALGLEFLAVTQSNGASHSSTRLAYTIDRQSHVRCSTSRAPGTR
jgi:D-beta-D-heptose 7-phosphate kinase/D-beta-D-heptose 1-phosphate adenosyltransferase